MMKFFPTQPTEGKPLSMKGIAEGLRAIEKALGGISVKDGFVDWQNNIPKIIMDSENGWDSEETIGGGSGAGLPSGGEKYQVLQRQNGVEWVEGDPLDAVWDWVRWP